MGFLGEAKSYVNNLRFFSGLFPPRLVLPNLVTLPLDYVRPDGRAAPPMAINLLTTTRCNLDCVMCSAANFRRERRKELSPRQVEKLCEELKSYRPSFFFGGGEPLVRADFYDLCAVVKGYGFPLGMVTNGFRLTKDLAARLAALRVDVVMFSLYGPKEVHDSITKVDGAFARTAANIEYFCSIKAPETKVILNVVPSKENVDHLLEMVELGRRLGVDQVRLDHLLFVTPPELERHRKFVSERLSPVLSGLRVVNTHVTTLDELNHLSDEVPGIFLEAHRRYGDFVYLKPWLSEGEMRDWYHEGFKNSRRCLFVWRSLFVDPEGYVLPCFYYIGQRMGNVTEQPLLEIWNNRSYRELRKALRKGLFPACNRCCRL